MHHCCQSWKLEVYTQKTERVTVFSHGKIRNIPRFIYNNKELKVIYKFRYLHLSLESHVHQPSWRVTLHGCADVSDLPRDLDGYLGIIFNYNGKFSLCKKKTFAYV